MVHILCFVIVLNIKQTVRISNPPVSYWDPRLKIERGSTRSGVPGYLVSVRLLEMAVAMMSKLNGMPIQEGRRETMMTVWVPADVLKVAVPLQLHMFHYAKGSSPKGVAPFPLVSVLVILESDLADWA